MRGRIPTAGRIIQAGMWTTRTGSTCRSAGGPVRRIRRRRRSRGRRSRSLLLLLLLHQVPVPPSVKPVPRGDGQDVPGGGEGQRGDRPPERVRADALASRGGRRGRGERGRRSRGGASLATPNSPASTSTSTASPSPACLGEHGRVQPPEPHLVVERARHQKAALARVPPDDPRRPAVARERRDGRARAGVGDFDGVVAVRGGHLLLLKRGKRGKKEKKSAIVSLS